ncbi:MAG: Gfo/Idh/MocA family oxidoreductase [Chloroflexi bacterium]|nr:Gfo/Idh/MocA family oxidoreductase [Chloroflexota bacterium]
MTEKKSVVEPVRWGVLGCARIANNWVAPAIVATPSAQLWAVASRAPDRAQEMARRFGAQKAYGAYEQLLADPDVEAVYIPLPNHLHKPWAIAALRAGKHVLCEKPIALNAAEAREMQAVAQETGNLLVEAFMYRYSPLMRQALQIVRAGELGELRAIHSAFTFVLPDDPRNVRLQADMGGGALYDVGCYAIHVQRLFAGREPVSTYARCLWSEQYGVDLNCAGLLDFGQGLVGSLHAGFDTPGNTFFRLLGTKGSLEGPDGFSPRERPGVLVLNRAGLTRRLTVPQANAYEQEVRDFSEAVRGAHPLLYGNESLDANMRVIDACYASAKSGQAVTVS